MSGRFTYAETEAFYDAEDSFYRSFWDSEGSLHWGVFDDETGPDFLEACANLNRIMATMAGIDSDANVLDLGCGNGVVATWLCRTFGCRVTGIDLSGVRIENAKELQQRQPHEIAEKLSFAKASATELPYPDGSFSHVWSQAVIYHVHDKERALEEAHRVLASDGRFVFDDLIKPQPRISEEVQAYVYDRLKFDTDFSFQSYQAALRDAGFTVVEARDLSADLETSYECLAEIAEEHVNGAETDKYRNMTAVYRKMAQAVERRELGWGLYSCEK
jgi:ubiquinone/menaquinone biosynthesis C-methylase UbiE